MRDYGGVPGDEPRQPHWRPSRAQLRWPNPQDLLPLRPDGVHRWRIDPVGAMRVPAVVFASRGLLAEKIADRPPADGVQVTEGQALRQVANVACLPGIVEASFAMPDIHWGYGFAIGAVAATDPDDGGVVSPGGVGFDISCGVRLLRCSVDREAITGRLDRVMDLLDRAIPRGMGRGAVLPVSAGSELDRYLIDGSAEAVRRGYGEPDDLTFCEDRGRVEDADPQAVSARARERGAAQLGSLGSGNHFLEVQVVQQVYDAAAAHTLDLAEGQITIMIHCGSRGLGHEICSEYVRAMQTAMPRHGIAVPDPQLACVPVASDEGRRYLSAMSAAANFGRANRQLLTHAVRGVFAEAGLGEVGLVYDVSHNLAKMEDHTVGPVRRRLCVHRKGATRAFGPGHPELPDQLRHCGQPVLVPGSMGTASYVLLGLPDAPAFQSACHGAGRTQSRHAAAKHTQAKRLREQLAAAGVHVRGASARGLVEETPSAYKDIDEVVAVCDQAGLARPVARLIPIGVVKG